MKKLFIIAGVTLLPFFAFAQGKPFKDYPFITDTAKNIATEQYCIVYPESSGLKIRFNVDFGYHVNEHDRYPLVDNNRKELKFYSIADGLNYMARQGWVFVDTINNREGYASYAQVVKLGAVKIITSESNRFYKY